MESFGQVCFAEIERYELAELNQSAILIIKCIGIYRQTQSPYDTNKQISSFKSL